MTRIEAVGLFIFSLALVWQARVVYLDPERVRKAAPRRAKYFPQAYTDGMLRFNACCSVVAAVVCMYVSIRFGIIN